MSDMIRRLPEFTQWKTETHRFLYRGNTVTLHSTGQVYITRSDGVLIGYHEMKCGFGCMRLT